jgi:hypothetical protein
VTADEIRQAADVVRTVVKKGEYVRIETGAEVCIGGGI